MHHPNDLHAIVALPVKDEILADDPGTRVKRDLRPRPAEQWLATEERAGLFDLRDEANCRLWTIGCDIVADVNEVGLCLWSKAVHAQEMPSGSRIVAPLQTGEDLHAITRWPAINTVLPKAAEFFDLTFANRLVQFP